jgi:hypothetical protein
MKREFKPERAEEFSKMLMNTFRYQMNDANDIAILAAVCKAWGMKLKNKQYPATLLKMMLVSRPRIPDADREPC